MKKLKELILQHNGEGFPISVGFYYTDSIGAPGVSYRWFNYGVIEEIEPNWFKIKSPYISMKDEYLSFKTIELAVEKLSDTYNKMITE